MLPATLPQFDPKHLLRRLGRLRRRTRLVTALAGILALTAVLAGGAAVAGLLDWRFQLPPLVRAAALVAILTAAGCVLVRRLLRPLRRSADNLRLALLIEERNPELNDILASAVEFLDQPADDEASSSPLLRRLTIRHAVRMSEECDFGELVSLRGLTLSALGAAAALLLALPPVVRHPAAVETAMMRLLAPFGVGEWPAQTQVRVTSPDRWPYRHPLGEALEIRAEISGVVPERATLSVWFDGAPPVDSTWVVEPDGSLAARLEAGKVQRSFRFRVRANDGATPWHDVMVLPPPELVPLDGRPSPQLRLEFPAYTDLAPRPLPDGGTTFEAVAGTRVSLRAAVNRPVSRAWIAYRPELPVLTTSAALAALGSAGPLEFAASAAAGRSVWDRVPVAVGRDGTLLEAAFTPRLPGVYALRFEDETGFGATRLIDANVLPDPAPAVTLDRPSATHDSLSVTPKAVLPLKSTIVDQLFAVRSAWLEYRTARDGPASSRPQFDHAAPGRALAAAFAGPRLRLRLQSVLVDGKLAIESLRHPDGKPLKEGDVVIIQMAADDFDDVTMSKEPGRSHEIELKIVSPATLEAMLQLEQANVRANLLRLQQWQKEARAKAADVKAQKDAAGTLRPEDQEKLLQAEQLQQQVRARVGDDKEGLRAEVNRIRQALTDNRLPPSAAQNRMDAVASELERLAREELEALAPLLGAAREMSPDRAEKSDAPKSERQKKDDPPKAGGAARDASKADPMNGEPKKPDAAAPPTKPDSAKTDPAKDNAQKADLAKGSPETRSEKPKDPLAEALRLQQDVGQSLDKMLQRLEPWSGANEVRGEARAVLNEQEKIGRQTDELDRKVEKKGREELESQQKADLDQAAGRQEALANQLKQLMDKMDRLAAEKQAQAGDRSKQAQELDDKARDAERQATQQPDAGHQQDLRVQAEKLRQQAQDQKDAAANLQKETDALKDAAKTARDRLSQDSATPTPQTKLHQAAKEIKENQLGNARQRQQEAAEALKKMLDRLEERRTDDLDRLAKKLRDAEKRLDDLVDQQERLQKKVKEAQKIADAQQRQQELERLAREQERLQEEAKDLLQELSRQKAEEAARSLSRATRSMEEARQRLERGEKADDSQEDALEKLDQAQDQLEQQRQMVEEELAREKLEKVSERVKAIRERQAALNKEMRRLHDAAARAKKWEDALLQSLNDQADAQRGLGGELERVVEGHFKSIKVVARMLEHSAGAMRLAAQHAEARRDDIKNRPIDEPFDPALEQQLHDPVVKWQETALRRIDQLLDALKPDKELKPQGAGGQPPGGAGGGGGGGGGRGGEDVPLLAQLKALRALQAEINERTAQFAREHPDLGKLTEDEQDELKLIRRMQADIAELLREYNVAEEPKEGGRP